MARPNGAAAELAAKDLKGYQVTNETNPVTVVGAQNVLPGDPERTLWIIYNLSASDIYVGFGGEVGANNGMIVPSGGGFITMNVTEDYEAVTLPVWVYSSAAGNQLYIMSTRRDGKYQE